MEERRANLVKFWRRTQRVVAPGGGAFRRWRNTAWLQAQMRRDGRHAFHRAE